MFLSLLDPDPDPLVRGMDLDPLVRGTNPALNMAPDPSIIAKIVRKILISSVL